VSGSVTVKANEFKRDSIPKQSLPLPTAALPLPDEDSPNSTAVDEEVGVALSKQSNPASRGSRSMQMSRQLVLESSISVEVKPDGGSDNLADTSGSHFALSGSSSVTGVSGSQKGRSELLSKFQRHPRLAGRQRKHCRRGNMAILRRQGLARVLCGELEKSGQTFMQVMMNLLMLHQC
jgi:hypothetical protein